MASGSLVLKRLGLLRRDLGGKANSTEPTKPAGPSPALTPRIKPAASTQLSPPARKTTA
jgi:hypothetical protein